MGFLTQVPQVWNPSILMKPLSHIMCDSIAYCQPLSMEYQEFGEE